MPVINLQNGANITLEFNSGPLDGGSPIGAPGTLQYNDNSLWGSIPFAVYNANGNLTLGSNSNIKITGGTPGQVLATDGGGNLSWTAPQPGVVTVDTVGSGLGFTLSNTVVGSTTTVQLGIPSQSTLRTQLNIGTIANINTTGSATTWLRGDGTFVNIAVPTGNIANTNYSGNISQYLRGDGTWVAVPAPTLVSNATHAVTSDISNSVSGSNVLGPVGSATTAAHALVADVSNSVAGGNVVGAVPLATVAISATTANSVAGGNVVGTVGSAAVATVAATANSIVGSNVVGAVANATHSIVSDLANSVSGSNVVGAVAVATLATNATNATTVPAGGVIGTVANANYSAFSGVASVANSIVAANIVGSVPNAIHSTTANTVTNAAQPNITSLGTLTGLTSTGNIFANANLVTDNILGRIGGVTITAAGVNQPIILNPSGTGVVNMSSSLITNVLDPVAPSDAATKGYVDAVAQGLFVHETCLAATTGPLTGIYNNGVAGVGATFTPSLALTSLDGVALVNGDRVLLKDQADQTQNGIYVIGLAGTVLTRATDADEPGDFEGGDFVLVQSGIVNSGSGWIQISPVTTIGADPIVYQQFSAAGSYTAGAGLQLIGSQFSMADTTVVPGTYGNGTHSAVYTVNPRGQLTLSTTQLITPNAANLTGTTLSPTVVTSSLTSVGTLGTLNVTGNINVGANINAAGGNFSTISGGLVTGTQPNITSIGTLSSLSVAGVANLGSVSNLIIEGGAIGQVLTSLGGPVQWSNSLTLVNANITQTANIKDLIVSNRANLGNIDNVKIFGGNSTQVLHTNGFGDLYWEDILSNVFQPSMEFVASVSGINQTFTSANIGNFDDKTFASVYVNGVLMRNSQYDITGSVLTVYDYLQIGDEISVGATLTGGLAEGTVKSISTDVIDPSSIGFSLDTPGGVPITTVGTITLNVPPASAFAAAVNARDYLMLSNSVATLSPSSNAALIGGTVLTQRAGSGISYDPVTGLYTLTPNVTYRLYALVTGWGPGRYGADHNPTYFDWVFSNNQPIYNLLGLALTPRTYPGYALTEITPGTAEIIYTPTTAVSIKLVRIFPNDLGIGGSETRAIKVIIQQV